MLLHHRRAAIRAVRQGKYNNYPVLVPCFYTTEDQLYELFRKVSATKTTSTLPSHLRGAAVRAVWQGTVSATTSTLLLDIEGKKD